MVTTRLLSNNDKLNTNSREGNEVKKLQKFSITQTICWPGYQSRKANLSTEKHKKINILHHN